VRRIMKKITQAEPKIRDVAKGDLDDAKVAVVSFGASARPSYGAVKKLREEGIKAGLLRLKTLWPLPDEEFADLANKVDAILVVEMNAGKLVREVQRVACGKTKIASLTRLGGVTPTQGDIVQELRRLAQ
jgi:2-oxoglutarate ferredoxin oxidoreductase subunit alpha